MHVGGPPRLKFIFVRAVTRRRDIIQQRIEPDIGHVIGIEGQIDPPAHSRLRPRDAQVVERFSQKSEDLVLAVFGLDETGVSVDVIDELLLVLAHLEEIILLLDPLHVAELAGVLFLFGDETLFGHRIPAFILVGIDVALVVDVLQHFLHNGLMTVFGGADKVVVPDLEPFP